MGILERQWISISGSCHIDIEGLKIRIPSVDDLIRNKRASGRTKDLADVEALESLNISEQGQSD
jgi:hypothetical protein